MKSWIKALGLGLAMVSAALIVSCRKGGNAAEKDLEQAGYAMTVDDWMRAAASGENDVVKRFLAAGFDAGIKNAAGDAAVHAAAASGHESVLNELLNRGVEVDVRGANDRTPLMAAVSGDQTSSVRWLLRQGADVRLRDAEGYSPLLIAVREGRVGAVTELASHSREDLDGALLLAALLGKAGVIDTLTSYGASVYARMEDGRTPLMLASQNGHMDAAELLVDLGSSRYSVCNAGRTASDYAEEAGHPDLQMVISRHVSDVNLSLDTPEQVLDALVERDDAVLGLITTENHEDDMVPSRTITDEPVVLLQDAVVSAKPSESVVSEDQPSEIAPPPLVMRHFRQRELPVRVRGVEGTTAMLEITSDEIHEVSVNPGELIPETTIEVVRAYRRMQSGKLNDGEPVEVSVMEVRDRQTGATRSWYSDQPASTHEPSALVEDAVTGRRYVAVPGQQFRADDGRVFVVSDVRPNQIIITESGSGESHTLPLRGSRG